MHSKRVYWSSVLCISLTACTGVDSQPTDEEAVDEGALASVANLITNGSFELQYELTAGIYGAWPANADLWAPIGYYGATNSLPGWTVGGDGVDWHDSSSGPRGGEPSAVDGARTVDLNSAVGLNAGTISQTIASTPGAKYVMTFFYSAHPYGGCYPGPRPMLASAGSASLVVTPDPVSEGYSGGINVWHSASLPFTATSTSTTISFASLVGNTCAGPLVDKVVVEALPIINVDTTGCNPIAINNAIGQSFRVPAATSLDHFDIWIKPELYYTTAYNVEVYDSEGTGGVKIATSAPVSMGSQTGGAASTWYSFAFGKGVSLQANHAYTFKLVRLSQYSGAFSHCGNVYASGIEYWLGYSASSGNDMSFRLYGN
ncbi:hypothetical protein BE20_00030 [Sorangium cellulosum]|uniref:DUF642 domain-containing protein n=1 Tax=Sorangium cellulosum TaxID=56 RepID=A0A150RUG1_SORCE|nr:hypothetical protein BE18_35120 [Sorangium cellulosum]KYF99607.1 hypothetical protein BE20_00030 [Sorangium cellulosum]